MTNLKLKDIIEMPKGIWSWDTLKEMTLFKYQNTDRNELYRMKNFSKKSEHKLDEATKEWISPIKDWDVQLQTVERGDRSHAASVDIYHECKVVKSFDFLLHNIYTSDDILPEYQKLMEKLNNLSCPTAVSLAILN